MDERTDMELAMVRVGVLPGDSLVAREGPAIVVVRPTDARQEEFVDELLGLCMTAGRDPSSDSGTALFRRIGSLVTKTVADLVPSLGILTVADDAFLLLLAGDMRAWISHEPGHDEELSGRDAATFVDRVVTGAIHQIVITQNDRSASADARSSLKAGVVRGGGVSVRPTGVYDARGPRDETAVDLVSTPWQAGEAAAPRSRAVSPTLVPTPKAAAADQNDDPSDLSFTPISLTDPPTDAPDPTTISAAADTEDGEQRVVTSAASDSRNRAMQQVQGIICSRGHLNNPEARFCSSCGISMVQQTHNLVTGPRPPLGVLVTDDGAVYALRSDYVIGRDPEGADDVREGTSLPLPLDDPKLALSRVHARIVLDGWEVRVEDAHSANGTFVAATTESEWERLDAGVPTTVQPGARISLGGRTLAFESHHRP